MLVLEEWIVGINMCQHVAGVIERAEETLSSCTDDELMGIKSSTYGNSNRSGKRVVD